MARARAARQLPRDARGARRRGKPVGRVARGHDRHPLRVLTPRVEVAAGRGSRCGSQRTDARTTGCSRRRGAFASAAPPGSARAEQAGPLHARGQAGQGATPDRRRREEELSAQAAQIAGAVASVGLAALIVARPREARVAGLGAWAIGCVLLAFYLAPSSHQRVLGAAAVVGVLVAVGLALLFRRWPWALAFLTLACVPARIPVRVGGTEANLLCRCTRSSQAPRCCSPGSSCVATSAHASSARLRGPRRVRRVDGSVAALVGRPAPGSDRAVFFFYLPFGLLAVSLAQLPWSRAQSCWLLGELVAMAIALRRSGSTSGRRGTSSGTRR